MIRRPHRHRHSRFPWEVPLLLAVPIVTLVIAGLCARAVPAQVQRGSHCYRMVAVRDMRGRYIPLYSDDTFIEPIANPFVAKDGVWQLHTPGASNVKIEESSCDWEVY